MAIALLNAGPNTVVSEPPDIPLKFVTPQKQWDQTLTAYRYDLLDHAVNNVVNCSKNWVWSNGESGTPYYDSNSGAWFVENPSFGDYEPFYGDGSETTLYFYSYSGGSVFLTLTSVSQIDEEQYSYSMTDGDGATYSGQGWPDTYYIYRDSDGLEVSLSSGVNPSCEIGYTDTGYITIWESHEVNLQTNVDTSSCIKFPTQRTGESLKFIVRIDMSELTPEEVPPITFLGGTIVNNVPTFTNKLYILKFSEESPGSFVLSDLLLPDQIVEMIGNLESIIDGI